MDLNYQIEDIYPLSPMQQGMLFHSLYASQNGVYFQQLNCRLTGELNLQAFTHSWQAIIDRHATLRTGFDWESADEPVQIVYKEVPLSLVEHDWRHLSPSQQEEALEQLLNEDETRGFDLDAPPLMRFTLIRLEERIYQMIWSHHHLLMDGWCFPLLLGEFFALYASHAAGFSFSLPQPRPYRDYIAWLQHQDQTQSISFWQNYLQGFNQPTVLTNESGITHNPDSHSVEHHNELRIRLSRKTTAAIQAFAQQYRVTANTFIQGIWALLLSRYSQSLDVVFGTITSGRPPELLGVERMIGLFINTLPTRIKISSHSTFCQWLQTIQAQQLEARQYEYTPLAQVQSWSDVEAGVPLFESILIFENYPSIDEERKKQKLDLRLEIIRASEKTNYPLALIAVIKEKLSLKFVYDSDRFSSAFISHLLDQMELLIHHVLQNPEKKLINLDFLTAVEKQAFVEWNNTALAYPQNVCLHTLIEQQVKQSPASIAVVAHEVHLTYAQLEHKANQLSHTLRRYGVKEEVRVAICLNRSPEMLIAILAILKAGGVYVPIEPHYPPSRIKFILQDSDAAVFLGEAALLANLNIVSIPCLDIASVCKALTNEPGAYPPLTNVLPSNLAYIIYTSGSTGTPKGVMVTHQGVVNYLNWCKKAYVTGERKSVPVHSPLSFDLTVTSLFCPLVVGHTVVLLFPEDGVHSLGEVIQSQGDFSLIKLTPAHLTLLNQMVSPEAAANATQLFVIGGEALTKEQIAFWQKQAPQTRLVNEYGPTETVVGCCTYEVPSKGVSQATVPIGQPIANTQIYLLDSFLNQVPIGARGEIYVGGHGVARGYLNQPGLTAVNFVPNPFISSDPKEENLIQSRLYRTGDLGRYLPDGDIEFLGRIDDQLKIRGYRIEPGEIESIISQYPQVQDVAVVATSQNGHKQLSAYLVTRAESKLESAHMRHYLQERLPDYMIPARFIQLDALPLTNNGKVNREALPQPDHERPTLKTPFVAPQTSIELALAEVWKQVLRIENVGVHDNFFELGGDSILSLQIVAKSKEAGFYITVKDIFDKPTISGLSTIAKTVSTIVAEQGEIVGSVPLTPIQHWFFEQNMPNPHHWNQTMLLATQTQLDQEALQKAVLYLYQQHDSLRLRFTATPFGWEQINAPFTQYSDAFVSVDLSIISDQLLSQTIEKHANDWHRNFDLGSGPLFRLIYFDCGPQRQDRLLLLAHHIIIDSVSWGIILADLQMAYQQIVKGQAVNLPEKTTSYKYWAEQLVAFARSEKLFQEQAYWFHPQRQNIQPLPIDQNFPSNLVVHSKHIIVSLSEDETSALLRDVPPVYNTQINDILLTALAQVIGKWSGEPRLLVNLEGHGREHIFEDVDISRTVGWFTSIYPVLLDLRQANGSAEAIKAVKEQLRQVPQRGIGYGVLRYLARIEPLVTDAQISFNYLGDFSQVAPEYSPLFAVPEPSGSVSDPQSPRAHLIDIIGRIQNNQLSVNWTYNHNLHAHETIYALAKSYIAALQKLINHCLTPNAGGFTPSDFPEANLDQAELDSFLSKMTRTRKK